MWNLIVLNLKIFARQKVQVIALSVVVGLICVAAGFTALNLFEGDFAAINIAVVDLDESFETRMIVNAITESDYGGAVVFYITSEASLINGEVSAIVTIPENFGESMIRGENKPFSVKYNQDHPLASTLVRLVADSFTDMLRSAQTGVYTALNYARSLGISGTEFNMILMGVNLMYMGLIMDRADIFYEETVYVTGGLNIWQGYFVSVYIALLLCLAFTITDSARKNFTPLFMKRFGEYKKVYFACVLTYFLFFSALNILVFGLLAGFSVAAGSVIIAAVAAAFAGMLVFKNSFSAGVFTGFFAAVSLVFSGGVVPLAFFSEGLRFLSFGFFNTWGFGLISALWLGDNFFVYFLGCIVFGIIFTGFGLVSARGRV